MWPFSRQPQTPASSAPASLPAPVVRQDWKQLRPLQRAIGEHPLTAPSDAFAGRLATHQDPSVASRTLGHQLSLDAPAGLVLAVSTPVMRQHGPAMVPRPRVQRRAPSTDQKLDLEAAAPEPEIETGLMPSRELPVVPAAPAVQLLTAPDTAPLPLDGGRSIAATLPAQSPMPAPAAEEHDEAPAMGAPARLTLGQSRRLGLGAPLTQVPTSSVQRAPADAFEFPLAGADREPAKIQPSPTASPVSAFSSPGSPTPLAPIEPLAPSRAGQDDPTSSMPDGRAPDSQPEPRLELPLAPPGSMPGPTPEAAEQHEAAVPETAATAGLPPHFDPVVFTPYAAAEPASRLRLLQRRAISASDPPPAAIPASAGPDIPVATSAGTARASTPMSAVSVETTTPRPAPDGAPPAFGARPPVADLPIVGSRPLHPTGSIQRATQTPPAAVHAPIGRALETDLSQTRVDRSEGAEIAATSVQALALTQGDTVMLPAARGSMESGPGRALVAHELTHVAQQRRYGASLPAEGTKAGERLALQAMAVERSAARDRPFALPLAPMATMASVQRATAIAESAATAAAPIQRAGVEAGSDDSSMIGLMSRGGPGNIAASAITPRAPGEPSGEPDIDALAGKLYERIRTRLRSELLVDRERAGFLTDLR